jgi:conjugative transfer signal peptidase TraF
MLAKCARLLSSGRPSTSADAIQPSHREGRLRAVVRWCKTLLPVVLSTGLASGVALALCSAVRLNISPSAPLGLYRIVDEPVARGVLVVACVSPAAARLARERGYLGEGSCPGGTQPVLKLVGAVPGDLVDLEPDGVAVNRARLPDSAPAVSDSRGRPLPHAPWGRTVVAPGEIWLMGVGTTRSWDSRYFGPVSLDHVHAVRPVLTFGGGR